MNTVRVHFDDVVGKVKPMHAVNNGPTKPIEAQMAAMARSNFWTFKEAGIPYVRNHDASFCTTYGGEHTVDVHAIFPNFDADVNDPASYDFMLTDIYCDTIQKAGAKVFYRLGSKIEHNPKKYGTLVPPDFQKWAEICEHIIRHYTEGWADGFHWDMEYWEIWNEPDLREENEPKERQSTWSGTIKEFHELFRITAKHLKSCFPHLKIGGPAIAHREQWADDFLAAMRADNVPLDFFSWHVYAREPEWIFNRMHHWRALLDKHGYTEAESICNEWNYVKGWTDEFIYSVEQIISIKGAAFTAATMLGCQYGPMDMLMYYDARVQCAFNGMFDFYTLRPLKGYYPFKMFNELYTLGESVRVNITGENLYAAAAKGENGESAVMLSCYTDDDLDTEKRPVTFKFENGAKKYDVYLLDKDNTMEKINTVKSGDTLPVAPQSVLLLKSV